MKLTFGSTNSFIKSMIGSKIFLMFDLVIVLKLKNTFHLNVQLLVQLKNTTANLLFNNDFLFLQQLL